MDPRRPEAGHHPNAPCFSAHRIAGTAAPTTDVRHRREHPGRDPARQRQCGRELADDRRRSLSALVAGSTAMIRIDEIWLATEPLDMRAGPDTALARVVAVFGVAKPHCAYLFANRRAN